MKIKKLFNKLVLSSLARQLIFGIAAVHAVLMTIFVFDLVERQRAFMLSQNKQQAIGLATTLATNGSSWVLSNDLVGIEEIIESQSHYPELQYAMFIDLNGKVLGYSEREKVGLYVGDDISKKILYGEQTLKTIHESDALIDVAAPVIVNDNVVGWARVGISRLSLSNNLNLVTKDGLLYTLIAIVVGVIFAWLMANGLSKGIRKLKNAIDNVSNGSRDIECRLGRYDELESLSKDFNKMLKILTENENEIISSHEALTSSERKLSDLINNLRTEYIFYSHDINGDFTYLSPSIENVLGYTFKEYSKRYDTFFTDNTINKLAIESTNKVLRGESTKPYEVEVFHKDGRRIRMEVSESALLNQNGEVVAVEGLARDVTALKEAAQKLQKEKNKFEQEQRLLESIINAIPDQIFFKNKNGCYLGSNKAFDNAIGYTKEQMRGVQDLDIFSQSQYDSIKKIEDEINQSDNAIQKEEIVSDENGTKHVLNTIYTNFKKENGDLLGYIHISRDISDLKNQEVQLRRSQKLDALGKLTGGIAHDYNNLLGVVIGYAELLSLSLNDEKLNEFANEIMKAGKRGVNLTNKLLAFTKTHNQSAESVNLNTLIESDFNLLQKTLTAKIDIKFDLAESLWNVLIDHNDFQDCILNMSINAMHAMPDGGELIFKTQNISVSKADINVENIEVGDYVQLSVTDTGCGMTNEVKDQLFDPFFTTKGDKGTGLGLSQVFGFIKRTNAYININSELGKGSTFNLYFRRLENDNHQNESEEMQPSLASAEGKIILVVDDEKALTELSSNILSGKGYVVFMANSVTEAIECLKKQRIDLVFSDVIMPDNDGYELATIIKKDFPNVKILLASGYTHPGIKKQEHHELTARLLHKPYTSQQLIDSVNKEFKNKLAS